jgi:hypothetical protein
MAIVTKGSGGSIKFSGTGGGISITSPGGGGAGGGGGTPDSANLYSLLRRGVGQTTTTNSAAETVVASWTDARGTGLGHPKFLPQGRWTTGGPARGCVANGDGSVMITNDSGAGKATFMRATTNDADSELSHVTNGSWTVYARVKKPVDPTYGVISMSGSPFGFYSIINFYGQPQDGGDKIYLYAGSTGWTTGNWTLYGEQVVGGSWQYPFGDNSNPWPMVGSQYVPTPPEYQTVVLRGSPAQGWSFRLSNSNNGGGSFGSNYSYSYNSAALNFGKIIWLGDQGGGDFNISDFAAYKSYHDESTATQIINHLTAAP